MTSKRVAYAYPTSDNAKTLGRHSTGCHYVEVGNAIASGAFDNVSAAEAEADKLPGEWCAMYQRHPLPGSRFSDSIIGRRVAIYTAHGDCEEATVIAELHNGTIKVRTDDGEVLIGNQWDDL